MHTKKHLSLESLVEGFHKIVSKFNDCRSADVDYSLNDIVLSGFACMFFQEPSLLQFQKRMQDELENNNLRTLFGVNDIPEST